MVQPRLEQDAFRFAFSKNAETFRDRLDRSPKGLERNACVIPPGAVLAFGRCFAEA
jgi:hypothetical protein